MQKKCKDLHITDEDDEVINIIIHSKYFSVSDWPKSQAQLFIITSYCQWKNFAICELMTSVVQQNCQIFEWLTEKTWG